MGSLNLVIRPKGRVTWFLEWRAPREAGFTEQRSLPAPFGWRITSRYSTDPTMPPQPLSTRQPLFPSFVFLHSSQWIMGKWGGQNQWLGLVSENHPEYPIDFWIYSSMSWHLLQKDSLFFYWLRLPDDPSLFRLQVMRERQILLKIACKFTSPFDFCGACECPANSMELFSVTRDNSSSHFMPTNSCPSTLHSFMHLMSWRNFLWGLKSIQRSFVRSK